VWRRGARHTEAAVAAGVSTSTLSMAARLPRRTQSCLLSNHRRLAAAGAAADMRAIISTTSKLLLLVVVVAGGPPHHLVGPLCVRHGVGRWRSGAAAVQRGWWCGGATAQGTVDQRETLCGFGMSCREANDTVLNAVPLDNAPRDDAKV
jgi:hypothetical protein